MHPHDPLSHHLSFFDPELPFDACSALSSTDLAPPQLDEFFCVAEAPGRRDELAALGLSERGVWG